MKKVFIDKGIKGLLSDGSKSRLIWLKSKNLNSYAIIIRRGLFQDIPKILNIGNRYLIITDSNVKQLYADDLKRLFDKEGKECSVLFFPAGEQSKNIETFINVHEEIGLSLDRESCIIALGGGVTGDLAGFVASTYMRGISFIQIPTSLLAMVDSSVGGKLGINTSKRKNSIGVFNNPRVVYIDPLMISTLPKSYLKDGLAEVMKHAIIGSRRYFNFISDHTNLILSLDSKIISRLIYESVKIKVSFVKIDEKESDTRRILNFGHTIGHTLEEVIGYGKISHGLAISIGMVAASHVSLSRGMIDKHTFTSIKNIISLLGLPLSLKNLNLKIDPEQIYEYLKYDKKVVSGKISFVLIKGISKPIIKDDITYQEIMEAINYVS
ncbi:MAG: 3-dehydroquinate synthase [Candidatus Hodarchaeota archaeon]